MAENKTPPVILQFAPLNRSVDEGFWHSFSSLKIDKLRVDDSPISITGFYATCSHPQVSNHLILLSKSLQSISLVHPPSQPNTSPLGDETHLPCFSFEVYKRAYKEIDFEWF